MYQFVHYRVRDVMSADPVTVAPELSLRETQALFEKHGFNGMPVVDHAGKLTGVVTKMDILRAFTLNPAHIVPPYTEIMGEPVATVMTRAPVTVKPDTPLTRVLQQLVELRIKSLPVVDNTDTLVGIVAREDILEALRTATE
ncbi:CBS domain-containing protein [Natronocella acetinitrilica]|uniref:CBS domain-containing protein n=1 Tax=Natronocella acetinitrilica TaxID=414046 RepID=A0AAE3G0A0_9GAMM|nr:CBS domain-containing protein [Natronocella acetinitrilica]MCP1672939.1 CBS domain-containing protein [Natronocella acetinitrilica]